MYKRLTDAQQTKNKVDPEVTLQFLKSKLLFNNLIVIIVS